MTGAGNEQVSQWTPPSWEEVVREHSGRVYRLAFRLTGNSHDAEDLTQEVFVRVFRSLPTYSPGTFEGWLHRITTTLFLDMTRRRQRIRFEGLGEETAGCCAAPSPRHRKLLMSGISISISPPRFADLPPEYRAAVVLCDIEGLTYEEIADVLGVKLGTVRSRIHRGRAQLRAALEHRRPRRPGAALLSDVAKPPVVKPQIVKPQIVEPRVAEPNLAKAELSQCGASNGRGDPSYESPRTLAFRGRSTANWPGSSATGC